MLPLQASGQAMHWALQRAVQVNTAAPST